MGGMVAHTGQAGLEYMIMTGILLTFLAATVVYIQSQSADTIRINQAQDAVREIAATADRTAALGPGTKTFVIVTMPEEIASSYIASHEINIRLTLANGQTDIFEVTNANVTGTLPLQSGLQKVQIEALSSGTVNITGNITV